MTKTLKLQKVKEYDFKQLQEEEVLLIPQKSNCGKRKNRVTIYLNSDEYNNLLKSVEEKRADNVNYIIRDTLKKNNII